MRARPMNRIACVVAGVAAVAMTLTACGDSKDSGKPAIVASTNVWGDIATVIAGPDAQVQALITDPAADPHSFESTAVDTAKIADADLVVYNGGGYDEFIDKALQGRNKRTIDAFESRIDTSDENEHVWYDPATVGIVADRIAAALGEIDGGHAKDYIDRATAFKAELNTITAITAEIAAERPGTPVLQTEPIAHYLLRSANVEDRTPHDFQEAIEQETDPAPTAVAAIRDRLTGKQVRALIYNVQTQSKVTKDLREIATAAGVPVVEVTETLPAGTTYVQWQTKNAQALAAALN